MLMKMGLLFFSCRKLPLLSVKRGLFFWNASLICFRKKVHQSVHNECTKLVLQLEVFLWSSEPIIHNECTKGLLNQLYMTDHDCISNYNWMGLNLKCQHP